MIVPRSEARGPTVCVYSMIVEALDDGFLGAKHGVAAFVIQLLEYSYNAAPCCRRSLTSGRESIDSTRQH